MVTLGNGSRTDFHHHHHKPALAFAAAADTDAWCGYTLTHSKVFLLSLFYRYDSSSGTFIVPAGGDGYYYFSVYLIVWYLEYGFFDVQINGETICTAYADRENSIYLDRGRTSCSAAAFASEGKKHISCHFPWDIIDFLLTSN